MKLKKFTNRVFIFVFTLLLIFTALPVMALKSGQTPMAAPEPVWSATDFGTVTWSNDSNALGYNYYVQYNGMTIPGSLTYLKNNKAVSSSADISAYISRYGYGQYVVCVSAVAALPQNSDSLYASTKALTFGYAAQLPGYGIVLPGTGSYYNPYYYNNYLVYLLIHNIRIKLDKNELDGYIGENYTLTANVVTPYRPYLTWSSSNEDVAVVDDNGNVTFVGKGSAIITVTDANAGSDTCEVTVRKDRIVKLNRIG